MLARRFIIRLILVGIGSTMVTANAQTLSLDLGADQWVLGLLAKKDIYAVSHLATSPSLSYLHHKTQGVRIHHNRPEEFLNNTIKMVIGYHPISPFYKMLFKKKGVRVVELKHPQTLEELKQQIMFITRLFNQKRKGEIWCRQLAHICQRKRGKILIFTGHRYAPGRHTLYGAITEKLGFARPPFKGWRYLSLERVLTYAPDHIGYTTPLPRTPFWQGMCKKARCVHINQSHILSPYPEAVLSLARDLEKEAA